MLYMLAPSHSLASLAFGLCDLLLPASYGTDRVALHRTPMVFNCLYHPLLQVGEAPHQLWLIQTLNNYSLT